MGKNNSEIQISDEDVYALGEAIGKTMSEAAHTIVKFSVCVSGMLDEVTKIMKKINETLHETYLANGAPYGDSQAGFFLWLKEEQERATSLLTHPVSSQDSQKLARNGDEHDQ